MEENEFITEACIGCDSEDLTVKTRRVDVVCNCCGTSYRLTDGSITHVVSR